MYQKTRGVEHVVRSLASQTTPPALSADLDQNILALDDVYPSTGKLLVWLETPLNPSGECRSIEACMLFVSLVSRPY